MRKQIVLNVTHLLDSDQEPCVGWSSEVKFAITRAAWQEASPSDDEGGGAC